jgi:flagellin-like hook-associated protein FlgL
VVQAINDAGTSIVATIDPEREAILLTDSGGGSTISVEDLDGGTLAQDLGIATSSDTASIEGTDLDPALTENTATALLFRGAGLAPGTWTLRVAGDAGTLTATIDPTQANTIGDLLHLIESAVTSEGAPLGIRASVAGDHILLESTKLHTTLMVSDDASPGSATAMGLAATAGPRDVFALLEEAALAVESRETSGMDRALRDLTRAIETTAGMRGAYGARSRQVLQLRDRILDENTDLTIRLADIEDVDLAKAALELAQAESVYNAALSVGARH